MKILHNEKWHPDGVSPDNGEEYLYAVSGRVVDGSLINYGGHTAIFKTIDPDEVKAAQERQWRDSELLRTDNWPDDRPPGGHAVLSYRVELRDYPNSNNFPNGTRPAL